MTSVENTEGSGEGTEGVGRGAPGGLNRVSGAIIGAAIEVHRQLGPSLLESAYEACLERELTVRGLGVERQGDGLNHGHRRRGRGRGRLLLLLGNGDSVYNVSCCHQLAPSAAGVSAAVKMS